MRQQVVVNSGQKNETINYDIISLQITKKC